jgi:excinuclease UvrABC helicase subunit UvrB
MSKTFDELFEDFFKRNNISPNDNISDGLKDEAKKMIDMLSDFKSVENIDESMEQEIDDSLGTPDKIEFYNEGELFFERRTWHTQNGDLIKLIVSDDPTLTKIPKPKKSLKQQLDEAVATEDFEKAAAIRDEMKKTK